MLWNDSVDPSNDPKSVTFGQLVRHSALELILTFLILFGVASIVRWVIGPSLISRTFPEIQVELLLVGASVAILNRRSNPQSAGKSDRGSHESSHLFSDVAVRGFFPARGSSHTSLLSCLDQLGILVARAVWGPVVAEPSVAYAVLQPRPGWSGAEHSKRPG
jgi:hypothetical protein